MELSVQQAQLEDVVYPRWCKASAYFVSILLGLDCDESLRILDTQDSPTAALADAAATTDPAVSPISLSDIPKILRIITAKVALLVHVMSAFAKWTLLVVHHSAPSSHAE